MQKKVKQRGNNKEGTGDIPTSGKKLISVNTYLSFILFKLRLKRGLINFFYSSLHKSLRFVDISSFNSRPISFFTLTYPFTLICESPLRLFSLAKTFPIIVVKGKMRQKKDLLRSGTSIWDPHLPTILPLQSLSTSHYPPLYPCAHSQP